MDSKFADRMAEVGQVDSDTLNRRWEAVIRIADAADSNQKARLILIASRDEVLRDLDEWFWEPFRAVEDTFRVDDAVELHSRLADAAARKIIGDGDTVLPMLVRLAQLDGRTFATMDLVVDANIALTEADIKIPAAPALKNYWTTTVRDALKPAAGPDAAVIAGHLSTVAGQSQAGLSELYRHVATLTNWANDVEYRFSSGQRMIEWLLAGIRGDGKPWGQLNPAEVAVDAAVELSNLLSGPPQSRHEALLAQVLTVAKVDDKPVKATVAGVNAKFEANHSDAFAALTPVTSSLAAGDKSDAFSPAELSLRVLWETATRRTWDAE